MSLVKMISQIARSDKNLGDTPQVRAAMFNRSWFVKPYVLHLLTLCLFGAKKPQKSLTGVFDIERLPIGKSVTFPRPATTVIPPLARVQLTGTDIPQSLSLKAVNMSSSTKEGTLRISIYDQNAERVFYKELTPDTVYIYTLRDLRPLLMITEGGDHRLKLQVESDKPLEIGR